VLLHGGVEAVVRTGWAPVLPAAGPHPGTVRGGAAAASANAYSPSHGNSQPTAITKFVPEPVSVVLDSPSAFATSATKLRSGWP